MPKAVVTTRGGATVAIEGTHEEVTALLGLFERGEREEAHSCDLRPVRPQQANSKTTPMELLLDLITQGYFATPKELGAVRLALEERGHFYPVTTLSPLMLRLVRRRTLRRIKNNKRWTYVG